jgi:putative ABC transport system substrate-binding protein
MRRREFIAGLGGAAAVLPLPARAQQAGKAPVVALLSPLTLVEATRNIREFRRGLRDLGYVEGDNIKLEMRFADGQASRFPELAAALVESKPDVIVAGSPGAIRAIRLASPGIPLVIITIDDPVSLGFVKSIARPATNVTGTWIAGDEALVSKRISLLKNVAPSIAKLAGLANPSDATDTPIFRLLPAAAQALGIDYQMIGVGVASELEAAFANAARGGVHAVFVSQSPFFHTNRKDVVGFAAKYRLPAIYGWREFAEAGGLLSYGPVLAEIYRRSATFVDKILKGANPAEMPVEIPTRFELVINLKAAKAIDLSISDAFLLLADEVIE